MKNAASYDQIKSIKVISFDAGHTLVWPNYSLLALELTVFCGRPIFATECMLAERKVRAQNKTFLHEEKNGLPAYAFDYYGGLACQLMGSDIPKSGDFNDFVRRCHRISTKGNLFTAVGQDVPISLDRLKQQGYRLCITSNASGQVQRSFSKLGLANYFDLILDSGVENLTKPELFSRLIERTQTEPRHILHIGDNPIADVLGAQSFGCQALHYDSQNVYPRMEMPSRTYRNLVDLTDGLLL